MEQRINVLLVEDNDLDAELVAGRLRAGGVGVAALDRVFDRARFAAALDRGGYDVILCDYSIPGFGGPEALDLARARRPEVPFIVVSGMLGEEIAVDMLQRGAVDYVLKQRLDRLPTAVTRAVAACRERRAREDAEARLRVSEQRYRMLVEELEDFAIFMVDLGGRVTSWNAGAERVLGYTEAEVIGRDLGIFYTPEDRSAGVPQAEMAESARGGRASDERWHVRKDGARFFASGVVTALREPGGRVIGYSKIMRDTTERWRAEQAVRAARDAAEAANRAKDRFLAVLSHELRTPLTPVLATVHLLEHLPGVTGELRDRVDVIRRNVELEARLIDDLLDLTRIARGKLQLHRQPTSLHRAVRDAVDICRDELRAKGLSIEFDLRARRATVDADPARLQQVVWNLVKNAVKFTPPGGTIRVRSADGVAPGTAAIEVQDTGIGIGPDALNRIFRPFEQADEEVTRKFGGLGLGLAIARSLAQLHGGTLEALSEGEGRGATFRVTLPATAGAEGAAPAPDLAQPQLKRQLRILLVEDHEDTSQVMSILLRRNGHQVTVASTVRDAVAHAGRDAFDLLISDIGLPDGTGLDVIRQMPHKGMPAIALTGFGMEQDVARSREAGFREHLTKPVNFRKLEAAISSVASG